MKRLNPMDASWLYLESPETPMHVATLMILSLPKNAPGDFGQDLIRQMREVGTIASPFDQKLAPGLGRNVAPAWVTAEDFDIDYHLRHSALPRPGGMRELGVLISRLHGICMDRSRPLWECHVIEGLEGNRIALYTKVHHSLMDGVGGMRLMQATLSENPKATQMPPPWAQGARKPRPRADSGPAGAADMVAQLLSQFGDQLKSVPGVTRTFRDMARAAVKRSDSALTVPYQAPKSALNVPITGQRRFAIQSFEIDQIRKLGKRAGATINDVVMAMCAGAMRSYLEEIGELPDKPLIANIPVSIRPSDGEDTGNAISTILASMATDESDPKQRLELISKSIRSSKKQLQQMSRSAIINYTILVMAPFSVGQLVGMGKRGRPMFNVVVSNVPGPKKPLYFNGAKLDELYPVSLLFNGQALNITVTSYVDTLDFGFTACRSALPHVQKMAIYTREALEELESALR